MPRCRAPEKGGPSSEGCARRGCHEEHEFRKPGPGRPIRHNQKDLFLVLTDLAQCLCEKAHWGSANLRKPKASCVPVHPCRGGLCQGVIQLAVGGLVEDNQVHLSFPELTPEQTDHLGMESPFSRERELS